MSARIIYLRDVKGQPVGCVAIGSIFSTNPYSYNVFYNLSVLNPADKFSRKIAREIAIGRLEKSPNSYTVPVRENENMHTITRSVMSDIVSNKNMPSRAIKAAKRWIGNHPGLVMVK